MIKMESLPVKNRDVAYRNMDGRGVLVRADGGEVDILNSSGTLLWENIDGKKTVSELVVCLRDEYEVDEETARKDVLEFLENLLGKNAIIIS